MKAPPVALIRRPAFLPALAGAVAFVVVVSRIDGVGTYPALRGGPGLTIDESFNVQQGARLAVGAKGWLLGALTWKEIFGEPEDLGPGAVFGYHLPDHPPLGRLWLGIWHEAVLLLAPPTHSPGTFVTSAARFGSAAAFAVTVFLVGFAAARWYGPLAGAAACAATVLSPRLFGHAHLAALETATNLAFVLATLAVADGWSRSDPPRPRAAAIAGALFGLALLTKIQAIFLPPAVVVWTLIRWRRRGLAPLAVWGTVAAAVFFVGWPWLWLDPLDHVLQYLGRTMNRATIHVFYAGRAWADRDVPWHYPWATFVATVPLPWLALGFAGAIRAFRGNAVATLKPELDVAGSWAGPSAPVSRAIAPVRSVVALAGSREGLLLGAILVPLILFSVPGVAVYDGERLFLPAYALWPLLVGRAFSVDTGGAQDDRRSAMCASSTSASTPSLVARTVSRRRVVAPALLACAAALGAWDVARVAPCWLGGYGLLVGQERGARAFGFEANYWGDAVTHDLLDALAGAAEPGAAVGVTPTLHALQLPDLAAQSPALRRKRLVLRPLDMETPADWLLVIERRADLPATLPELLHRYEEVKSIERGGVRLASVWRRRPSGPPDSTASPAIR